MTEQNVGAIIIALVAYFTFLVVGCAWLICSAISQATISIHEAIRESHEI